MGAFISYRIEGARPDQMVDILLNPQETKLANRRTLEELGNQVKTAASSEIRNRYNIKKSDLDLLIKFMKPRIDNLEAVIEVKGKPIPLLYFGAKQVTGQNRLITRTQGNQLKRASRLGQGVTYQVLRREAAKNQPHWFIQYDSRLHQLRVFYRKDARRDSWRAAFVITVASMFNTEEVRQTIDALVAAKGPEIWQRNWRYYLQRAGK